MSMICYKMRVSQGELDSFLNNSQLLEQRFEADYKTGVLDLDKMWDVLLFALTGYSIEELDQTSGPLKWAIFGDHIIDENHDMGYGPANYVTPIEVKQVNETIKVITPAAFRSLFDKLDKTKTEAVYGWWSDKQAFDDHFNNYLEWFVDMQQFFSDAASNNEAVISFIC